MDDSPLYVATIIGVTEDQWFEDGHEGSAVVRSEKQYSVHSMIYAAENAEAAYQWALAYMKSGTDRNHDGPGNLTLMYCLGIYQIERLLIEASQLPREVHEYWGIEAGYFLPAEVDSNGVPRIRQKHELEIFRIPES